MTSLSPQVCLGAENGSVPRRGNWAPGTTPATGMIPRRTKLSSSFSGSAGQVSSLTHSFGTRVSTGRQLKSSMGTQPTRHEQIMVDAFDEVAAVAEQHDVSLRTAAYILSIDRVASVYRLRGVFA